MINPEKVTKRDEERERERERGRVIRGEE